MSEHQICPVCWVVCDYEQRKSLQPLKDDYWLEHIGKEHHPFDLVLFANQVFQDCYHEGHFEVEKR